VLKNVVDFLFGIGLFVNALLFIPQIFLLLRKKHADDVSLTLFFGFACIQLITIAHGLFTQDTILVIGYAISLLMCITISSLIVFYRIKSRSKPHPFDH